ncbi:MAG: flagellar hook-length control protein FliK [Limnochordia bacterium]
MQFGVLLEALLSPTPKHSGGVRHVFQAEGDDSFAGLFQMFVDAEPGELPLELETAQEVEPQQLGMVQPLPEVAYPPEAMEGDGAVDVPEQDRGAGGHQLEPPRRRMPERKRTGTELAPATELWRGPRLLPGSPGYLVAPEIPVEPVDVVERTAPVSRYAQVLAAKESRVLADTFTQPVALSRLVQRFGPHRHLEPAADTVTARLMQESGELLVDAEQPPPQPGMHSVRPTVLQTQLPADTLMEAEGTLVPTETGSPQPQLDRSVVWEPEFLWVLPVKTEGDNATFQNDPARLAPDAETPQNPSLNEVTLEQVQWRRSPKILQPAEDEAAPPEAAQAANLSDVGEPPEMEGEADTGAQLVKPDTAERKTPDKREHQVETMGPPLRPSGEASAAAAPVSDPRPLEVQQPIGMDDPVTGTQVDLSEPAEAAVEIAERIQAVFAGGRSEVRIQLKPEHLGELKIKVAVEQGVISAEFIAESQAVKSIIQAHLPELRTALQDLGTNVAELAVHVGTQEQPWRQDQNNGRPQWWTPSRRASRTGVPVEDSAAVTTYVRDSWNQIDLRA